MDVRGGGCANGFIVIQDYVRSTIRKRRETQNQKSNAQKHALLKVDEIFRRHQNAPKSQITDPPDINAPTNAPPRPEQTTEMSKRRTTIES